MNSSGVRPARSSQSGTKPASGATRSGGESVESRATDDDDCVACIMLLEEGANVADGAASAARRAVDVIFIVFYKCLCVLYIDCFVLLSCSCCVVEDL